LHQVGDLFELNVKLWCQKVKYIGKVIIYPSFTTHLFSSILFIHNMFRPKEPPSSITMKINKEN